MMLLAKNPFRGTFEFEADGIDADFEVGYDIEKERLTFKIEGQEFDQMGKIPRTKRPKHPVYRLERENKNDGRKKKTTEYEIAFCEVREEGKDGPDQAGGDAAAEENDIVALTQVKIAINYDFRIKKLTISFDNNKKDDYVVNHKALADLGPISTFIPGSAHGLKVEYRGEDMFAIEINKIPFEQLPFLSPDRDLAAGFGQNLKASLIKVNNRTIWLKESNHWEPQDFIDRLANKEIYVATRVDGNHPAVPISSVVMQGLSASPVVIDELFDLLGQIIDAGALQKLVLGFASGKEITHLSPHVFEVLARKCTALKQFELFCTDTMEADQPRQAVHDFFA